MKYISVLGDSISTYEGFNPKRYSVFYTGEKNTVNRTEDVEDTWWMRVINGLNGELLINDSYSGSTVSGKYFPAASSKRRTENLGKNGISPDIILIYIGINDFATGVKISPRNVIEREMPFNFFYPSYEKMLSQLKSVFPAAEIICCTIMTPGLEGAPLWKFPENYGGIPFDNYNDSIRQACEKKGCHLIDLNKSGIRYETLDGTHPTQKGHKQIADTFLKLYNEKDKT